MFTKKNIYRVLGTLVFRIAIQATFRSNRYGLKPQATIQASDVEKSIVFTDK